MAKKKAKKKATKKKSAGRKPSPTAKVRTGGLFDVVTLRAAKVAAAERSCTVAEVLGEWAKKGRG